jgi:hypothetical protein
MKVLKSLSLLTIAAAAIFMVPGNHASAARVAVDIGLAPVCPYGYYEVPPYNCAPDGYYGPEWFVNGLFIGAGPWFHGPEHFYGHVDHRLDFRHGYRGGFPARGESPAAQRREFHGNAMHDFRGHEAPRGRR